MYQEEQTTDKELISKFRAGDENAYMMLVDRYTEKVHNLAMRISRSEEDTDEIIQDVFVTVHQKIDSFQGKSAFSSWLYRVTANTAFMKLRKRKRHTAVSFEELGTDSPNTTFVQLENHSAGDAMVSRCELRSALETAVESLPLDYRKIFVLRDVDGLSNQEVAGILGISVPAVKSRLHRSRLMLRKRLQRLYDDYTGDRIDFGPGATIDAENIERHLV